MGETHPNFQRTHFSSLPMTKTCIFCGTLSDVVVHAFCSEGHCERRECVDKCASCQEWFMAIEPPKTPEELPKEKNREVTPPEKYPTWRITEIAWDEYRDRMEKANRRHGNKNNFASDNADASGYVAEDHVLRWLESKGIAAKKLSSDESRSPIDLIALGRRIDVKSTNRTVDPVRPHYHVNVKEEHLHNPLTTDFIFSSFNTRTLVSELVGWLSKEEFIQTARKMERGEKSNRMTARNTMRCCQIKDLRSMESLLEGAKEKPKPEKKPKPEEWE